MIGENRIMLIEIFIYMLKKFLKKSQKLNKEYLKRVILCRSMPKHRQRKCVNDKDDSSKKSVGYNLYKARVYILAGKDLKVANQKQLTQEKYVEQVINIKYYKKQIKQRLYIRKSSSFSFLEKRSIPITSIKIESDHTERKNYAI
ncbi:unnamed protein product [Paramecium octaurelia]|uniref:Uncharacterized protein n=1 Tax=Paramecium octaurelia TaxID=43137 RepID=A0A8S1WIA9_PAROT|nr:unnamed protein product [Paramecium octaurelia]